MQGVLQLFSGLNPNLAFPLILIGLIYGLVGWRVLRYLVLLDAVAVAALLGVVLRDAANWAGPLELWLLPTALLLIGLPWMGWRYPRQAAIGLCGLVGFLSVALFLVDVYLPLFAWLALGALGAAFAMALATTLVRQTTIVVTGLHGSWLCVAALALLGAHPSNFLGGFLSALNAHYTMVIPLAVVVVASILIAVQWSGVGQDGDALYVQ